MHTETHTKTHTDPSAFTNPNLGDPLDIAEFSHMIGFANQSAAMEFLLSVKSGLKDTAYALTEASTPEIRAWLKKQLFAGLDMHEKVYHLMADRAWLHPYDPIEQSRVDLQAAEMTGNIARMPLFKDRTKVLESFDTSN